MMPKKFSLFVVSIVLMGIVLFGSSVNKVASSTTGTFGNPIAFIDQTSIDLHWNHPDPSYDTYVISRDGQVIFTTGTSVIFYRDTGLTDGQTYTYQIDAFEADEFKQSSGPKTATAGEIGGDLYQDKIWPAGIYDLSDHIDIHPGVTFQIQSGAQVFPMTDQSISDFSGGTLEVVDATMHANLIVSQAGSVVNEVVFKEGKLYYERSDVFSSTNFFTEGAQLVIGYHVNSSPTIRSQSFESGAELWVNNAATVTIEQCIFEHARIGISGGTTVIRENVFREGGSTEKYVNSIQVNAGSSVQILENLFEDASIGIGGYMTGDVIIRDNLMGGGSPYYSGGVGIGVSGGAPEIKDNIIIGFGTGIGYGSSSADGGTATGNTIVFNTSAGIGIGNAAAPLIHNNCISQNGNGVDAYYISHTVDMTGNWWGAVSGPYHAVTNPDGLGDRVYGDTVDFSGWLTIDNCAAADLAFTDMEAIQVIGGELDWFTGKIDPLQAAAGRETIVRAYAESLIGIVEDVEGELKAYRDGEYLGALDSENTIIIEPGVELEAQRADLQEGAVYFELPAAWTTPGTITYTVTLNPDHSPTELRTTNNVMTETITFNDQVPFRIAYVPILYQPGAGEGVPPPIGKILGGHIFLQSILPHAQVEMGLFPALTWKEQMNGADEHDEWDRGSELLNILSVMLIQWNLTHPPEERFNQIMGVFPGDPREMISFANSDPRWARNDLPSMGLGLASYCWASGDCFAHSIGHNLGLHHTNVSGEECYAPDTESYWMYHYIDNTIATFGYHDLRNELVPATTPDIMSFCENTWVSSLHWEMLMAANGIPQPAFDGETSPTAVVNAAAAAASPTAETAYLLVRAWTTFEGVTKFLPFWTTPATSLPVWTPDNGSDYCIRMEDGSGNVIEEKCVDAYFYNHETMNWTIFKYMVVALPLPANAASQNVNDILADVAEISVYSNDHSWEVAARQPSAHQPEVAFLSPTAGSVLSGDTQLTWSGTDADGDDLIYSLYYRPAADAPWNPLVVDVTENSYLVKLQDLPAGSAGQFKVEASDGYHVVEALSGSMTVPERTPAVYLLTPIADENYAPTVVLSGYGYHPDNGLLPDSALTWESDQDGLLGTGSTITITLSEGTHLLTLTGTYGDQTATASVSIQVNAAPVYITGLTISGPSEAAPGDPVTLQASVITGTDITYTWEFGDWTTATGKTVTHVYPPYEYSYTVKLTASNTLGQLTTHKNITITMDAAAHKIFLPLVIR